MTENHSDLKAVRSHESNISCYIQPSWICAEICTMQKHRKMCGKGETKKNKNQSNKIPQIPKPKNVKKKKNKKENKSKKQSPCKGSFTKTTTNKERKETMILVFEYRVLYLF